MAVVAGVDEAGRGCVIGPLVLCAFAVEDAEQDALRRRGVKDSKLLTAAARTRLNHHLAQDANYALAAISAREITDAMRARVSLNELEAQKAGELLTALEAKRPFSRAYLDSPDANAAKFAARVKKYYKGSAQLIAENKADARYPVVGAASVLAKVARDAAIEGIKKKTGIEFGSGYSSDPRTVAVLEQHTHFDALEDFIRHEWETAKRLRPPAPRATTGGLADYL